MAVSERDRDSGSIRLCEKESERETQCVSE